MFFYLDVYILLNFIMNLFLIMITAMIRQKRCRFFRLFAVSLVTSLLSAAITYFFWQNLLLQILFVVPQTGGLVLFSFAFEGRRSFLEDYIAFLFLTFFAGGCIGVVLHLLAVLGNESNALGKLLAAVILLFILFLCFRWKIVQQQNRNASVLSAKLTHRGKECSIRVLYDTGNHLISPYSGECVAVISQKLADKIELSKQQYPLCIPYSSVGGKGLLEAYRIERLLLSDGSVRKDFLAAISQNLNEDNEIQMILNKK